MKGASVEETPVFITVNGQAVLQTTCSPTLLEAFAAGRLLAEGYVHERDDLRSIIVEGNDNERRIKVELPLPAAQAGEGERRHRTQHACGILYYLECAPETLRRPWPGEAPDVSVFPNLYEELFASAADYRETGGMHSASLSDGRSTFFHAHDVGRHNAADKSIGLGLIAGEDLSRVGLLLTSRISGEIALKAARAGLAWVASRSIPTTLALRIAAAASLPLVGRAPGKDAYTHNPTPPSVA
jgi:FdhD protein